MSNEGPKIWLPSSNPFEPSDNRNTSLSDNLKVHAIYLFIYEALSFHMWKRITVV